MIIYPKDVQRITGRSERYCRYLLKRIRQLNSKEGHQFVTVDEFSSYTGLAREHLIPFLID